MTDCCAKSAYAFARSGAHHVGAKMYEWKCFDAVDVSGVAIAHCRLSQLALVRAAKHVARDKDGLPLSRALSATTSPCIT